MRLYTRCRQRVLGLYVDATFAGFRRRFGAPRGSPTRIIERWGFRRDKLRAGSKRRYIFGLHTAHKAIERRQGFPDTNVVSVGGSAHARALLLVSFLARARKVHPRPLAARANSILGDCHGRKRPRNDRKRVRKKSAPSSFRAKKNTPVFFVTKTAQKRDFARFSHKNGDFPAKNGFLFDKKQFFHDFFKNFQKTIAIYKSKCYNSLVNRKNGRFSHKNVYYLCIFTALFNARKKTAFFRAFFQAIQLMAVVRARGAGDGRWTRKKILKK